MQKKIYSVAEITSIIKQLLESSLPTIWVEGEISNFRPHYSGHYYFTLKDSQAQLSGVMWRSRAERLAFVPEDGMKVQALGNIRLYEPAGRYQLDILQMQPAGEGRLQMAFEQLKQKLFAEGLFDEIHKQSLPSFPLRIGIITSPTGAAIRDILNVLKRRASYAEIVLRPAAVQGVQAAQDLIAALDELEEYGNVDVIIIGRGGGSLEDLWAFNDEQLARRIHRCEIPVVSAVGHEIDFTISDFVADVRAATPSAAAEIVAPDKNDLILAIKNTRRQLIRLSEQNLQNLQEKILTLANSYGLRRVDDQLYQNMQKVDDLNRRMHSAVGSSLTAMNERLNHLEKRLQGLGPQNVLKRGYSITSLDGRIVRNSKEIKKGDLLETQLHLGKFNSRVE